MVIKNKIITFDLLLIYLLIFTIENHKEMNKIIMHFNSFVKNRTLIRLEIPNSLTVLRKLIGTLGKYCNKDTIKILICLIV